MMRRIIVALILVWAAMSATSAVAQSATPARPSADISVGIDTASHSRAGEAMRHARQVLTTLSSPFAPQGRIMFQLRPAAGTMWNDIRLSLTVGTNSYPLPINADGLVSLPEDLADSAWTLETAGATTSFALRPVVFSPGTSAGDRRIGDLRAQCRLFFSLAGETIDAASRAGFLQYGGCSGPLFEFYLSSDRLVDTANIGGTMVLELARGGAAVRVPINDEAISNDARLTLTYK
jgi:hypothetical protein